MMQHECIVYQDVSPASSACEWALKGHLIEQWQGGTKREKEIEG